MTSRNKREGHYAGTYLNRHFRGVSRGNIGMRIQGWTVTTIPDSLLAQQCGLERLDKMRKAIHRMQVAATKMTGWSIHLPNGKTLEITPRLKEIA
jgi:hypothetical protein